MNSPVIPPVITIDGPSGTGKGTLAHRLAAALGWHVLDSGMIYRAVAYAILAEKIDLKDMAALEMLLVHFPERSSPSLIELRQERVGMMAAQVGALPIVRQAMLSYQRAYRIDPGLIADGRDMGTVVFPDAIVKIYLDASLEIRVMRRYQELRAKGNDVSLADVASDLSIRDECDRTRLAGPLVPAEGAIVIDTSMLNADHVFDRAMHLVPLRYRVSPQQGVE